jgi:AbiV family abortive infection protein
MGDACHLYRLGNYPLATFVAILAIEEVGKLSRLANELTLYDAPLAPPEPASVDRSHRRKHFLAVMSGALIMRVLIGSWARMSFGDFARRGK